ncbi:MAG: hypothetical protein ACLFWD_13870 [Anaerolineales bacterium]
MKPMPARKPNIFLQILLSPILLIARIPPHLGLLAVLLMVAVGFGIIGQVNSDFLGLLSPSLTKFVFSSGNENVTAPDNRSWTIHYESDQDSTFTGVVRHVSHWRDESLPFATHDILVTTGEFASRERVSVAVVMHTFSYTYDHSPRPTGRINLLHIIPGSPEIYRQLLQVRDWNKVTISGREILRIESFSPEGEYLGAWQDRGCNSILVTSVTIHAQGTPIP